MDEEQQLIMITKKEYDYLIKCDNFLSCLEACGVDNWSGYSDAIEMANEEE